MYGTNLIKIWEIDEIICTFKQYRVSQQRKIVGWWFLDDFLIANMRNIEYKCIISHSTTLIFECYFISAVSCDFSTNPPLSLIRDPPECVNNVKFIYFYLHSDSYAVFAHKWWTFQTERTAHLCYTQWRKSIQIWIKRMSFVVYFIIITCIPKYRKSQLHERTDVNEWAQIG